MENFSYGSYPDSGDSSSPRSREIEFENPSPWEDHQHHHHPPQNYKQAKFMCSYGGKILPRPHDNHLCYVGGETKILAVDRSIKLPALIAKLSVLYGCDDVSIKYQLPGEDLDALISISNDEDLDHMMLEYDRLYRTSARPARMRLFLFQSLVNLRGSFGSEGSRPDPELFIEALNSAPIMPPDHVIKPTAVTNKAEFLFGPERAVAPPPPPPPQPPPPPPPLPVFPAGIPLVSRAVDSIETVIGGYTGDYYTPKVVPEKIPASLATVPPAVSAPVGYWPEMQVSSGGFSTPVTSLPVTREQPVYVIPASGGVGAVFHQPMVQPVTRPTAPVYGHVPQWVASDIYRELPVYNVAPPPPPPPPPPPLPLPLSAMPLSATPPPIITVPRQNIPTPSAALANTIIPPITTVPLPNIPPPSAALPNTIVPPISAALRNFPPQLANIAAATYPESMGIVRHGAGVGAATETVPYGPVAYDGAMGRQVYYASPGGMVVAPTMAPPAPVLPGTIPPLAAAVAVGSDRRAGGGLGLEGKVVVGKVSQGSV